MQVNALPIRIQKVLLVISSLIFYGFFAYDLVRTEHIKLLGLYFGLFFMFYKIIQTCKTNIKLLEYYAFAIRAVFILAIPNLSQDFYRFIWDGRMVLEGLNPYLFTVDSFIKNGTFPVIQAQELYEGMGNLNASHFSNYPPLNQLCFTIAGLISGKSILGSVVIMRLLIIAADFGTLHYGKKLLARLNLPTHYIFWYILNPFIIIELSGNLHFEGVMIFFLILSLYLLHLEKWKWAAVVFSLSVSIKLIPLIFLPLLFNYLGWKKSFVFYTIVGFLTTVFFLPFYSFQLVINYTETIALWFNNFEFNASIYYIAREIGYWFRGYNEIAIIGKVFAITTFLFVIGLAYFKKITSTTQLITVMLLVLSFYYFTATTVHPWYITTLLILSIYTRYKFPLIWSFSIILSYLAYLNTNTSDKTENLLIIALEYMIVYGYFLFEIIDFKRFPSIKKYF